MSAPSPSPSPQAVRPMAYLALVCLILVAVPWRLGEFYTGRTDPVVYAKAAVTLLALGLAFGAWLRSEGRSPRGVTPLLWFSAYAFIALIGGVLHGTGGPSMVLLVRLAIVVSTITLLAHTYSAAVLRNSLIAAMGTVSGVAIVTGLGSIAATGRLYGGVPPLNANEIARQAGVALLVVLAGWTVGNRQRFGMALVSVCAVAIWLTGSRTALACIVVGVVLIPLFARKVAPLGLIGGILGSATFIYLLFYTEVFTPLLIRNNVSTLSNRTIAWKAAIDYPKNLEQYVFGVGLTVKEIPVVAEYRDYQILDSTWVSALVQSGLLGTFCLLIFVLSALRVVKKRPANDRVPTLVVLIFLLLTSFLESGLGDTSTLLVIFLLFAIADSNWDLDRDSDWESPAEADQPRPVAQSAKQVFNSG